MINCMFAFEYGPKTSLECELENKTNAQEECP